MLQRSIGSSECWVSPGQDWVLVRHDPVPASLPALARYTAQNISSPTNPLLPLTVAVSAYYWDLTSPPCSGSHYCTANQVFIKQLRAESDY